MSKQTYFYKDKPVFGFDIGHGSLKVMQIDHSGKKPFVVGYGTANFEPSAIVDGNIVKPETIAKASLELFKHHLIGDITTNRAVIAIPAYRTFTRSMTLPKLSKKELDEAVQSEAAQYIPAPLEELYLDYNVIKQTTDKTELFVVAVPKKAVDSQIELMDLLGIEVVGVETTIGAAGHLFKHDTFSDVPTVLIDFGSLSADITVYDNNLLVTGTIEGGGENFTNLIRDKLKVSQTEAWIIKTKYGLGHSKKQKEIFAALEPVLTQLAKEIQRMIRYHQEHYGEKSKINQIFTLGGGANMPGLAEYLTDTLRLAVRSCDPWQYCEFRNLKQPNRADKTMYATVMGLSMVDPKELFS